MYNKIMSNKQLDHHLNLFLVNLNLNYADELYKTNTYSYNNNPQLNFLTR